jgi:serine/threonine protein kinase
MTLKKEIVFQSAFTTYTAIDVIGQGGAGCVHKVQDEAENKFAVKVLNPHSLNSERLKRFKNELMFCRNNKHPNILTVLDDGPYTKDGATVPFYVMPLYDSSLRTLINDGIPSEKILPYLSQLLNGVEAAHLKNVIHRDLKSENVLFSSSNDRLVIADFGIARFQEEELYTAVETKAASRLANFQYAAPEQRTRGAQMDSRTDIYALGLMLNEMFTNEIPLGTEYKRIASVDANYSYLDDLVASMLRQTSADRPASIEQIKLELIGRKNEFVEQQHLSELEDTVIPTSEIDDPLILDPPRLVDFDWENGLLTLVLSREVNELWRWAFGNLGNYTSVSGKPPTAFQITGREAKIRSDEQTVQRIIDYFKSWLPSVNKIYEEKVKEQKTIEENKLKQELEEKIKAIETRNRLKKSIKI